MSNEPNLLAEGFSLLAMGMGFVFVFLTLLVIATTLMSRLILHFSKPETPSVLAKTQPSTGFSPQLISAITAAIHLHKTKQQH